MENSIFENIKKLTKTHKNAAKLLGISYTRYNEWRWNPKIIPEYGKKLLTLTYEDLKRQKRAEFE